MPLLKLWNALLGRTASGTPVRSESNGSTSAAPPSHAAGPEPATSSPVEMGTRAKSTPRASKRPKKTKDKADTAAVVRLAALDAPVAPAAPPRQFKVVNRGEHAEVCRLVVTAQSSQPTLSVLEIGVGDGTRAEAMMQSLLAVGPQLDYRYMVIDQFEMTGGAVSLRDFHQRMRGLGVRPQVFPEPLVAGLSRFARTVGTVDLVVATIDEAVWHSAEVQALFARITRPNTVILRATSSGWRREEDRTTHAKPGRKVG